MKRTILAGIAIGTSLAIAPNAQAACFRCDGGGCQISTAECVKANLPAEVCQLIEKITPAVHCTA
jgi:hypothetical protein